MKMYVYMCVCDINLLSCGIKATPLILVSFPLFCLFFPTRFRVGGGLSLAPFVDHPPIKQTDWRPGPLCLRAPPGCEVGRSGYGKSGGGQNGKCATGMGETGSGTGTAVIGAGAE